MTAPQPSLTSPARTSPARLSGVDLSGARLSDTNFTGADLSRADLYGAGLPRADLTLADLYSADLTLADCSATRWLGISASRWVGMTGDGKGPAGGAGGALWCPGCRCGGRVVVVSRLRGRSACPPGRGGHWSFTSVIAARTAVVSAMVL